jgi:hypothetical protein
VLVWVRVGDRFCIFNITFGSFYDRTAVDDLVHGDDTTPSGVALGDQHDVRWLRVQRAIDCHHRDARANTIFTSKLIKLYLKQSPHHHINIATTCHHNH